MNRQQALNQLRLMQAWHEDFGDGPNADYDAICYAIGVIEAQPEGLDTLIKALEIEHKKLREMQKALPDCAKCKSELANKIRGQQDNPGMLTENDKGRNWGLEWAAQIVEGKRR